MCCDPGYVLGSRPARSRVCALCFILFILCGAAQRRKILRNLRGQGPEICMNCTNPHDVDGAGFGAKMIGAGMLAAPPVSNKRKVRNAAGWAQRMALLAWQEAGHTPNVPLPH